MEARGEERDSLLAGRECDEEQGYERITDIDCGRQGGVNLPSKMLFEVRINNCILPWPFSPEELQTP